MPCQNLNTAPSWCRLIQLAGHFRGWAAVDRQVRRVPVTYLRGTLRPLKRLTAGAAMEPGGSEESPLELGAALTDDLLLVVLGFLDARDLHRSAAPVCRKWCGPRCIQCSANLW